jgi:hypothetical protein
MIDWEKILTITEQAKLLHLNRTGLYCKAVGGTDEELKLRAETDKLNIVK